MSPPRVFSFHDARLSLAQSCLRELVCRRLGGGPGSGLGAGHPIMDAVGAVLAGIEQGTIADAATARATYRAERSRGPVAEVASPVGVAWDCLDLLAEYTLAWVFRNQAALAQIRSEFVGSACDPGWLTALVEWLEYYWDGQPPRYRRPGPDGPTPVPLPAPAAPGGVLRVGLLSDWGTGQPEAIAVLDQLMQQQPDLILHLGDIYYAGTPDECRANFLDPINAARAKYRRPIPVYSLAGNHDYYSGGAGYYATIPLLNGEFPDPQIQTHSFFCLRNDNWQLQGMDTGYNDHDLLKVDRDITRLRDDEVAWHAEQVAGAGSRRVILFSHHQLFSAFAKILAPASAPPVPVIPDYQNPYLTANLRTWQRAGSNNNIVAWFWGHEHLLEVYDDPRSDGSGLPIVGRCIGHGAFPVFVGAGIYTPNPAAAPVLPTSDSPFFVRTGHNGLTYNHGYALLELGAGVGTATYYQVTIPADGSTPSSQPLWAEAIPRPAGAPASG